MTSAHRHIGLKSCCRASIDHLLLRTTITDGLSWWMRLAWKYMLLVCLFFLHCSLHKSDSDTSASLINDQWRWKMQQKKLQKSTEEWWRTQLSSIYPLLKPHWKDSPSDSVTLPKGFCFQSATSVKWLTSWFWVIKCSSQSPSIPKVLLRGQSSASLFQIKLFFQFRFYEHAGQWVKRRQPSPKNRSLFHKKILLLLQNRMTNLLEITANLNGGGRMSLNWHSMWSTAISVIKGN